MASILSSVAGGALIGLSAALAWVYARKVAGISGLVSQVVAPEPQTSRDSFAVSFVAGLCFVGLASLLWGFFSSTSSAGYWTELYKVPSLREAAKLSVAGLLVGYGTQLARGCTSGHGVCGVSRLAKRSLIATTVFLATGILTATFIG